MYTCISVYWPPTTGGRTWTKVASVEGGRGGSIFIQASHEEGRPVYNGADRDGRDGNPGLEASTESSTAGTVKPSLSSAMARFGSRVRTRTSTTMPTARTYWSTNLAPATK